MIDKVCLLRSWESSPALVITIYKTTEQKKMYHGDSVRHILQESKANERFESFGRLKDPT
ncbi:hypothetical protein CGMCC3_g17340 [Colletotrichum fructicola]|nr:uncharacterized protein CGMCC3_g17340 [Colletotrichum fructicola]KAE9566498.1 hypothetical protein CGMCC3_g17340 [Colletotrichum fructicola]